MIKKISTLIIIIACVAIMGAILCYGSTYSASLGDVDGDGHITAADSQLVQDYILQGAHINHRRADINHDGIIDIADYTLIRLHWLGVQEIG